MKPRKLSPKRAEVAQKALAAAFHTLMMDLGATHTPDNFHHYHLDTRLGRLSLTPDPSPGQLLTIYARFQDPDRAKPVQGNPYTGKWNHYFDAATPTQEIISDFAEILRNYRLIPEPPNPDSRRENPPAACENPLKTSKTTHWNYPD